MDRDNTHSAYTLSVAEPVPSSDAPTSPLPTMPEGATARNTTVAEVPLRRAAMQCVVIPLDELKMPKLEKVGVMREHTVAMALPKGPVLEEFFVTFMTGNPEVPTIEIRSFGKNYRQAREKALAYLGSPKLITVEVD